VAVLTQLGDEELRAIAAIYGLSLRSARPVLAGSVNTNHELVDSDGGRWFLRLYEEQGAAGARRECALVRRLAEGGVPTPAPKSRPDGGGPIATWNGKAVALYPFVEGEHLCQARVRPEHTATVGAALARIHLLGEGLGPEERSELTAPSRFSERALLSRLVGVLEGPAPPEVHADAARILARLEPLASSPDPAPELPVVHGDLFRDNVLFEPSGALAALLDFESASRGTASFDVAVTVLAWCFGSELELELVRGFFGGYAGVRTPRPEELAALPRGLELACLRFATTRITDYELRSSGLGVRKDYRRWLARLDALDRHLEAILELARAVPAEREEV